MRGLFPLILIIFMLFSNTFAQENQNANKTEAAQTPIGNSLVSGRAVYEDTGLPATRHRVQLIASELLTTPHTRFRIPTAVSSENGDFSFRNILAGEYYVFTQPLDDHTHSGMPFPFPGQSSDSAIEQFKKDYTRIAVDGQHNLAINVRVPNPHFGSISGRILDSSGKPAVHTSVHLTTKGEKSFGANVRTDEQGEYKFLGLPAGEYVISASPPQQLSKEEESTRRFEGVLGATYFPSTLEYRSSPAVTVFADRDTGNIEIMLINGDLHRLAGSVRMRGDNRPVVNALVRLTKTENSNQVTEASKTSDIERAMSIYVGATDKNGNWRIANVPDGTYRLHIKSTPNELSNQLFVEETLDLTVEGADVENLTVDVSGGGRISGVITMEGSSAQPQFVRVQATRFKGNASSDIRLDTPGKFALPAVPAGEITLSAFALPQDKFYVKLIQANGLDLLRTTLAIADGEEIKDVRILISGNVGVVTGRVLSKEEKPIAGINLLLRRIKDDGLRSLGGKLMAKTDERGTFTISAAPGDYLVIAWRAEDPSGFEAAANRALHEQALTLTLQPGDRKKLDIRVPY